MTISALPTPPGPGDSRDVFNTRAFALLGALPLFVTEANAQATTVNSATTAASGSATAASGYASSASASAATATTAASTAINGPGTTATSTSDVLVGTGSKSFTLAQTGKAFTVGQWVYLADAASPSTRWVHGTITAFNSGTGALTVNVVRTAGASNCANWLVMPASPEYSVLTFDGSGNLSVQGDLGVTGTVRPYLSNSGRVFESKNTSVSNATQFYVDHSTAAVTIGNARGILNLTSTSAVQVSGNDIWHTGNLTPSLYAALASPNFSGTPTISGSAVVRASDLSPYALTSSLSSYLTIASAGSTYAPLGGSGASGTWGISISGTAAKGSTLAQGGGAGTAMTFSWTGNTGGTQPTWVWGGTIGDSSGATSSVYNPANFSVAYATTAGSAASASSVPWSGVSSKPINSITTTTSTSTPTGGTAGDLVFQY
jgi:hypothetical protein